MNSRISLTVVAAVVAGAVACNRPVAAQCHVQFLESPVQLYNFGGFGRGRAVVPGMIAIGAMASAIGWPGMPGGVYVYRHDGWEWSLADILTSGVVMPDGGNRFGSALAASNDVLAVGAGTDSFVQVFRLADGSFHFEQHLEVGSILFGHALAFDGDLLVVGAPAADAPQCPAGGLVYLYRFDGAEWVEEAQLDGAYCQSGNNLFGWEVATANGVVLVGDHSHNGPQTNTGVVIAFREIDGQFVREQILKPSDAGPETGAQWFGQSISISKDGATAVIGADDTNIGSLNQAGAAYVFEHDGTKWIETAKLTANPPNHLGAFGAHVAISDDGNMIIVCEWFFGGPAAKAHLYKRVGNDWILNGILPGGCFGVTISGDLAVMRVSGPFVRIIAGIHDVDCNNSGQPDGCDIALGFSKDLNNDGIPDECQTSPDLTGDANVGVGDLLILLKEWGPCPDFPTPQTCPADLNGDGTVGVADLLMLLASWGSLDLPHECSSPGDGDCCIAHGGAGCKDVACCKSICAEDAFCCSTLWDALCVIAARKVCECEPHESCTAGRPGQCCTPGGGSNGGPGCDDPQCCQLICDFMDPFCCEVEWDGICTGFAFLLCDCPPLVCSPEAGDCCVNTPGPTTPGCSDVACCQMVCEFDSFCCIAGWDALCRIHANNMCEVCQGD